MTPREPPDGRDDGSGVDAHLRAALRQAPDAQARPPDAVSQQILRSAHAAVRQPQGAPGRAAAVPARLTAWARWCAGLGAAWQSLGRGPAAGAMAGVLVAVAVGVMWSIPTPPSESEPLPLPSATVPDVSAPVAQPAPVPVPRPAPAPAPPSQTHAEIHADAPPPRPASPMPTPRTTPAPTPTPTAEADSAQPREEDRFTLSSGSESRGPALRREAERSRSAAAPEAQRAPRPTDSSPSVAARGDAPLFKMAPEAPMGTAAAPSPQRSPALSRWPPLNAEPLRWSWQADGETAVRPSTPAFQAWLAAVQVGTQGRWKPAPPDTAGTATPGSPLETPVATWQVRRDDGQVHRFMLFPLQLRWTSPDGKVQVAELDAATAAQWRQALTTRLQAKP